MNTKSSNRWLIAVAGVVMQVALDAVYAWSVFRIPLTQSYGWTVSQVTLVFELTIFMLGIAAFAGGLWMKRSGPCWHCCRRQRVLFETPKDEIKCSATGAVMRAPAPNPARVSPVIMPRLSGNHLIKVATGTM